jgi:thymidylate synthase (FAD)
MNIILVRMTEDPEALIESAYRICYTSKKSLNEESRREFIEDCISSGHESPLEHAVATFKFTDVTRSLLAQLTRHRLASYSVQSQRYVDAGKFSYIIPDSISENPEALDLYKTQVESQFHLYTKLRGLKIPKEDARMVLSEGTTTEILMTANFREWRHIINLRGLNKHAQWEIRALALAVLDLLYAKAPSVFEDLYELSRNHTEPS